MTYHLPVDWDAMQSITAAVLKEDLDSLRQDWEAVHASDKGKVFSLERDEDLEDMSKHISSFKLLIRYYGGEI